VRRPRVSAFFVSAVFRTALERPVLLEQRFVFAPESFGLLAPCLRLTDDTKQKRADREHCEDDHVHHPFPPCLIRISKRRPGIGDVALRVSDQSCIVDSDCVEVYVGNSCSCDIGCMTTIGPINKAAQPRYTADVASAPQVFCTCKPPPPVRVDAEPVACCVGGQCQTTPGHCSVPADAGAEASTPGQDGGAADAGTE
jgi:hypothetical protein